MSAVVRESSALRSKDSASIDSASIREKGQIPDEHCGGYEEQEHGPGVPDGDDAAKQVARDGQAEQERLEIDVFAYYLQFFEQFADYLFTTRRMSEVEPGVELLLKVRLPNGTFQFAQA